MEQFLIRVTMSGVPETQAGAAKVSTSMNEMAASGKAAAASQAAATRTLSQKWTAAGTSMVATGKILTRKLTLPIAALGVASGFMAKDFDQAMTLVHTQAGASAREVERLRQKVLDLAKASEFSPTELADGLFRVESAGYRGAEAMATLKAAVDLASVGQSSLEETTTVLTGAMQSGIKGTETAAKTVATLNAAVGQGSMRMQDLVGALSTGILPSAKSFGLTLRDVTSAIDLMTKQGVPAQQAATRLRMSFSLMAAPTSQARQALKEIGIGATDMAKAMMEPRGLIKAVGILREHLADLPKVKQEQVISEAFGGGRTSSGIIALVEGLDTLGDVYDETGKKAGEFGKAVTKQAETDSAKLKTAWSTVQVTLVDLGSKVLPAAVPALEGLAGIVGVVGEAFTGLPDPVQTATLGLLAFGLAAGPLLTVGGNLIKVVAGIATAFKGVAAANIVGELSAAASLARAGEFGGFAMVGRSMAGSLASGLRVGLPIAIAAAGIGNIVFSATKGDWKDAGFKAGGALVGGIAGAFVGGPLGAALGAGAGSFLGGALGDLFDTEKKLTPMQQRLQRTARATTHALRQQAKAADGVAKSQNRLNGANSRHEKSTHKVKRAQQQYRAALKKFGPDSLPALQAALRLARAEREEKNAAEAAKRAHRLNGVQLELFKVQTLRAVAAENRRIPPLRQTVDRLTAKWRKEKDNVALTDRLEKKVSQLNGAEGKRNTLLKEAGQVIGPKWQRSLEHMSRGVANAVGSVGQLRDAYKGLPSTAATMNQRMTNLFEGHGGMREILSNFKKASKRELAQDSGKYFKAFQRQGAGAFGGLAQSVYEADQNITSNTSSMLGGFGAAKLPKFSLAAPSKVPSRARGGPVRVPGAGLQDTVPLFGPRGLTAMVAPGEDLLVANRHQRPELDYAVWNTYGDRGMDGFYLRSNRPHNMARGGIVKQGSAHLPEPRISGPDPMRAGGQGAVHLAHSAAEDWLTKHMGPKAGLGTFDGKPVSAWIIPILAWARAHGWDGSVTSGHRNAAQQIAAATSYGLGNYGSSGPLGSNHVGIDYPRGAVDVSMASQLAAILRGYPGKPNLVWGGPVMNDPVHFSATGHQRGGIMKFERGGRLVQASVYGFGEAGTGTHGYKEDFLPGLQAYAELENGTALGNLPYKHQLEISRAGRSTIASKLDIGAGGPLNPKIDLWRDTAEKLGLSSSFSGKVRINDPSEKKEERVPGVFHGARTKALHFGSMPKTLHGVDRELNRRHSELTRYRQSLKAAKGKPKIERAIKANVTALENRVKQLRRERAKLRREAAKRKITRRLERQLGSITGVERHMQASERAYNIANELAEQIVAVEPQPPELPETATDAQREAADKKYLDDFSAHIETQERPAYEGVLTSLAKWRNVTLGGEATAGKMETRWEAEVRAVQHEIDRINALTKRHPSKWWHEHPKALANLKHQRAKLPTLRHRDHELRRVLGEARGIFYPGRKHPIRPPAPPLAGTGSFEDTLIGIQGTHWPDQHEKKPPAALAPPRRPGMFGGAIWDAQGSIEELGLKISQASSGLGGGGSDDGSGTDVLAEERAALLEEENLRLQRELLVSRAQTPVLADYLGAYEKGGILPGDGFYLGHKGEEVVPAGEVGRRGEVTFLQPIIQVSDELRPYITATIQAVSDASGRRVGLARGTPSAPGRRASLSGREGR